MYLIIDGYNLLNVSPEFNVRREELLENARNRLIEKLGLYKRQKKVSIVIVFDGWKGGLMTQSHERSRGIEIIYSKLGEKADEVIKRIIAESSKEMVVVSSDREIRDFAEGHSVISISSSEFEKKIEMASYMDIKGCDEEEDDYKKSSLSTKKKGNPRRLSKSNRRKGAKLRKL